MGLSFSEAFGNHLIPHEKIMESAIHTLGLNALARCIPFSIAEISTALAKGDEHLNTLCIKDWDAAAGFVFIRTKNEEVMHQIPCSFARLLHEHGITSYSCAQGVCVLKCAAKQIAKGSEGNGLVR